MRKIVPTLMLASAVAISSMAPSGARADDEHKIIDNIADIVITSAGTVGVDLKNDSTQAQYYVCSLSTTRNGVSPEACQGWLTLLTAAQLAGKKMRLDYGTVAPSGTGIVTYVKVYDN